MKKSKGVPGSKSSIPNTSFSTILIILLAAIPFLLGRYFEINYPDPFDSASNVYSAKHILDGAKIGVDENPSEALGTLFVNMLGVRLFGFSEVGPKLIQSVMQGVALVLMFIAMRKLFGKLPATVGVIVAAIYTSSPLIAKFGNVKEQYMIAFMVTAISLFILRQLGGKWWYSVLAGAVVSWAPLFKETGTSAIGAIGLFVIAQPIFRHRTWKQTGIDIALLLAGFAAATAPIYIWMLGWDIRAPLPYSFVWDAIAGLLPKPQTAQQAGGYVSSIRETLPFAEQWPRVLRYYLALCVPVLLALGSIAVRTGKMIFNLIRKSPAAEKPVYDRFVLLLGVWWLLDMAFVWISPASYEQYYLPLTASGAMTGGYLIAVYRDKLTGTIFKTKWIITGIAGLILMVIMSWHIFAGLPRSPYSGMKYSEKRNGYAQRWKEIQIRRNPGFGGTAWEVAGKYIRDHTLPADKIYVWGWVPGIYLSAQRFSSTPNAFESEMHTRSPEQLEQVIDGLLGCFKKEMPKYIADSRKQHLPLDRPKFELWPIIGYTSQGQPQFLPADPQMVAEFEKQWGAMLQNRFGEAEKRRFEIMGKFRKFIRENYEIAQLFGDIVVFKLKNEPARKGS